MEQIQKMCNEIFEVFESNNCNKTGDMIATTTFFLQTIIMIVADDDGPTVANNVVNLINKELSDCLD